MVEAIAYEDVTTLIRKAMDAVDDVTLFWVLRTRYKWSANANLDYVRLAIALRKLGLPLRLSFFKEFVGVGHNAALSALHRLGDMGVLTLKRDGDRKQLTYYVNPAFMAHFEPQEVNDR